MARVVIAAAARRDVKKIAQSLASEAGFATALAFSNALDELRARLSAYPNAYAIRASLGLAARVAVISPYLVVYEVAETNDRVTILRVIHGRRNITGDFAKMV